MKIVLIGPTYPFRGGLAHFTTLLAHNMRERHQVCFLSYCRQYPSWLFPGNTDPDPSDSVLQTECERLIDALDPRTYFATARRVVAEKPDLLLLQWWTPFWLPLHTIVARAARRAGIPIIYLCHQLVEPDSSPAEWQIARFGLRAADGFVTLTRREADRIMQVFPNRPVRLTHHPVYDAFPPITQSQAEARAQLGLPADVPLLLLFGFVRRYKGINYLLEALARCKQPVHLLIAGEFWEPEAEYRQQIAELGLTERVHIHNQYIPNEAVTPYFAATNAVVLPYTSGSQSGVAMIGVNYGIPIIASDVGGLADTITDQQNGLIVPPANSAALAAAIERFFAEQLEQPMRASMQQTSQRFSWGVLVEQIEELANELTARSA